jgi:hypothetical protein
MDEPSPEQLRSVHNLLLHLFILQAAVCVSVGHLGSLRKLSQGSHVTVVVFTVLFPAAPLVESILILSDAFQHYRELSRKGARFFLGCAAGVVIRLLPQGNRRPLHLSATFGLVKSD